MGVNVIPHERREGLQVSFCQLVLPVWPRQKPLDDQGIDVDHAVLQEVHAEHADLVVLPPVARNLPLAGEE